MLADIKAPNNPSNVKGQKINSKGYLVNKNGDIINKQGKVLFKVSELIDGEFPKILKSKENGFESVDGVKYIRNKAGKLVRVDVSQMLDEIEDELIQNQSIDQLESLT